MHVWLARSSLVSVSTSSWSVVSFCREQKQSSQSEICYNLKQFSEPKYTPAERRSIEENA